MLASRDIGLDSLSIYLVTPAAIPHPRNRCTWRAGAGLGCSDAAGPAAERAIPAGVICQPLRIAGSAVVQHRAEAYHCSVLERGPEGPLYTEEHNPAPM